MSTKEPIMAAEGIKMKYKDSSMSMLTLRLDIQLDQQLADIAAASGRSKSEVAREALRRQMVRETLDAIRRELAPAAQEAGLYTDEDVLKMLDADRARRRAVDPASQPPEHPQPLPPPDKGRTS